jgi:hypothetical protein
LGLFFVSLSPQPTSRNISPAYGNEL